MKITLVCLNSKFTHTSLGIWYIKQYCQSSKVDFSMLDTFVNRSTAEIVADILKTNPDIVGFSTYIFNVEKTVEVATEIKARGIRTVFGGPEATFNTKIHDLADQIILGEGERAWESIINGNNSHIIAGEETQNIAYPYTDEFFENAKNRMVYFEASRGCPFSCSYCMSAGTKLRQFPFEEVTRELLKFKNKDIRLIKFVDRTFNANKRYAERLLNWINENFSNDKIRFHFEVAPELFDEGLLNAIKNAKKGLFQFEIGYQSYSKKALEAVNRFENLEISASNIKKLVSFNNSHIHTDLIVGLPYEDMLSFKQSFNELYSLGGHQIQVGFLKVLKGSKLENELADGYVVNETPPYEVTETPWLTKNDIISLKRLEVAVDSVFNSQRFNSIIYYGLKYSSPFDFYSELSGYVTDFCQLFVLYDEVKKFMLSKGFDNETICNILKFDYLASNLNKLLPPAVEHCFNKDFKKKIKNIKSDYPDYRFYEFSVNPVTYQKKPCIIAFSSVFADEITKRFEYKIFDI